MAKPFTEWTVLPHGKLERVQDNLLSVTGLMNMPPMGPVTRRMTAVRWPTGDWSSSLTETSSPRTRPRCLAASPKSYGPESRS